MRPRSTGFCTSLAFGAALALAGCGGDETAPVAKLVEAEVRAATPAGWEPVAVELGEFEEAGVVNRSNVRFELTVEPTGPMAYLVRTVDGVNIVKPVTPPAGDKPAEITLYGTARVIEPVAGSDAEAIVRVDWRTGSRALGDQSDLELRPLDTLAPYVLEGSDEAVTLIEQRRAQMAALNQEQFELRKAQIEQEEQETLVAERAKSQARLERQALIEGEQIEFERLAAESRLEKERLSRLTLDEAEPGRWIDGGQFLQDISRLGPDVLVEREVSLGPDAVYAMLTTAEGFESFTGMPAEIEPRVGGRFTWDTTPDNSTTGLRTGRVLALRPGELLAIGLPPGSDVGEGGPSKAVVAFVLRETPEGALVRIVQTGMPAGGAWDRERADAERTWSALLDALQERAALGRDRP